MGCGARVLPLKGFLFFLFVCPIALPKVNAAQIPTVAGTGASGQILVRVKGADGAPMRELARVTLHSPSQLTNTTTSTSDAGQALFTGLSAGDYTVEVSAPGYQTVEQQATIVADGEIEYVEVLMKLSNGGSATVGVPGAPILAPKALKETEKGLKALQADKLDEAETHLKRALKLAPSFPDVNYLMGMLWLRRHDLAQARGYLEKAVQLAPKHAAALLALGESEFLQKDYAHAIISSEQSANLKPDSWRAQWIAGAAYFEERDYKKAEEHALEALRVGQDKAGSARFLLGEAQAALGEREAALVTLEQFVREQPNVPQTATAKKLMELLRVPMAPKAEGTATSIKAANVIVDLPRKNEVAGAETLTMPRIAPVTETNWAPPDVDEEKPVVDEGVTCDVNEVKRATGARVEQLVTNIERFTATEEMEHEALSPLGVEVSREERTFNYLVAIRRIGIRELDVQEYRDGSVSPQLFPAHLATMGLPVLALVFHPYYQDEFTFVCEGQGQWRGKRAWVVHFRQRSDKMSEMRVYHVGGMSFPVQLKGRAWIGAESSQILAMEADMVKPVPEIRLQRDHQLIEYAPVEFQKAKIPLWLPKSADWYCELAGKRYHRRHTFSHFLLFSVEDTQKIGTPKETDQQ